MENLNEATLMLMVGAALFIWNLMEGAAKPAIKQLVQRVTATQLVSWTIDESVYPYVFQGAAWLLGIGAVMFYRDLSLLKLFEVQPNAVSMEVLDVIATGFAISRGERGLHQVIDFLGNVIQKPAPESPPNES